jgi:uncharacterized DUF497 family protein
MYCFDWDENKNRANQKKHGVSFEEASTVFYDEAAWLEFDAVHSDDEDRFRIIGCSSQNNDLLVVYCMRSESVIRIISSRKATSNEIWNYERRMNT